jgi:hypothetical protein
MENVSKLEQGIDRAVAKLLRPLFRYLLRNGKSFSAFEEVAKRTIVDVALSEFGIPGKKPSISRASILSGLTRKEVQRLVQTPLHQDQATGERRNRAARVLTAWVRDADFLDAKGKPRPLEVEGDLSFATLVKRHSGDMPTRAMLDELVRVGAVEQRADGRIDLVERGYVPHKGTLEKLGILGSDVADLITTIDHNLNSESAEPRYQRKVMYQSVPAKDLPAFRQLSASQAQALLENLDQWLSERSVASTDGDSDAGTSRVGMGIYYFEEAVGDPARKEVTQ